MLIFKKIWNKYRLLSNVSQKCFHNIKIKSNNIYDKNNFTDSIFKNSLLKFQKKYEIKKHRSFEKCNIAPKLENFFLLLINETKLNLYSLLKNERFPFDANFIINSYKINKYIFKDQSIEDLLNKIILSENENSNTNIFSNISNKDQIFEICHLFSKDYLQSSSNPLSKRMLEVLRNKSYLMDKTDLLYLIDIINDPLVQENNNNVKNYLESYKNKDTENVNILYKYADHDNPNDPITKELVKRKEKSELRKISILENEKINYNFTQEEREIYHIDRNNIKINKNNLKFSLNLNKNKATIKSTFFKPKVYIYGIDDNQIENIMPVFDIVDKAETNVILFQERPVPKLNQEDKYIGLFDKSRIKAYYKEVLSSNKEKFAFNKLNKIVNNFNFKNYTILSF